MMLGLGTSHNYDNFGAQFRISRNASKPILSIRFKESAWMAHNTWHYSIDGAYRLYFGVSSGVTFLAGGNTDSSGICALFMSDTISGYKRL